MPGRPGHAEVRQPDWRLGGAVNAIEKAVAVLEAIASLREAWASRPELSHPYLSPPSLLPTLARAGEWAVTYPASCELTIAVMYLPAQADASGWGSEVRREVEEWIATETRRMNGCASTRPSIEWWPNPVMPFEISSDGPIVGVMQGATAMSASPVGSAGSTPGTTGRR